MSAFSLLVACAAAFAAAAGLFIVYIGFFVLEVLRGLRKG